MTDKFLPQTVPAYAATQAFNKLREIHSELYSTSGDYDLLAKVYVPEDADAGHWLNENLFDIEGIQRTLTTMTFKAF